MRTINSYITTLLILLSFNANVSAITVVEDNSGRKWLSDNDAEYIEDNSSNYYIYSSDNPITVTEGEVSQSIKGSYFFPNYGLRTAIQNKKNGKITKNELETNSTWQTLTISNSAGLFNPDNGGQKGLEYLTELTTLDIRDCANNYSTEVCLDLKKNIKLSRVYLSNHPKITGLDLSETAINLLRYDKATMKRLILKNCTQLGTTQNESLANTYWTVNNKANFTGTNWNGGNPAANAARSALVELDVEGCTGLKWLYCQYNNLQRLNAKNCSNLEDLFCNNNYICNRKAVAGGDDEIEDDIFVIAGCYNLIQLQAPTNLIHYLGLEGLIDPTTGESKLQQLLVSENFLDRIALENKKTEFPYLTRIIMHRCGLSDHKYHVIHHANLTQIQMNGGRYERDCPRHGTGTYWHDPSMKIEEVAAQDMPNLERLLCQKELLQTLEFNMNATDTYTGEKYNNTITYIQIGQNIMLSLDLSKLRALNNKSCTWRRQEAIQDLHVFRNEGGVDKVGIYLPNGYHDNIGGVNRVSELSVNGTAATPEKLTKDGKDYLIISSGATADLDLANKMITYKYNTGVPLDDSWFDPSTLSSDKNLTKNLEVKITAYPYIMYMNPATKSGTGIDYYSGTIYLDYEAIVPKGVKAYIATGTTSTEVFTSGGGTSTEDQLVLVEVADGDNSERNVIPAYTPVYVKSTTETGLLPFDKTWEPVNGGWLGNRADVAEGYKILEYNPGDTEVLQYREGRKEGVAAAVTIPEDNILVGTLEDKAVEPRTTLTLGRESKKGTRMIGFWPYEGTTIKAHRCYIPESSITWPTTSAKEGLTFCFEENTEINDIIALQDKRKDGTEKATVWHTLTGIQLTGEPLQKGIYIKNGEKVVVR